MFIDGYEIDKVQSKITGMDNKGIQNLLSECAKNPITSPYFYYYKKEIKVYTECCPGYTGLSLGCPTRKYWYN